LTNTDILGITENAEGLVDVFTRIFHATQDLSDSDQRKAFAGLFGSYQVSKMMALTKGMGELEQGVGQVSEAYRIAGMDAQEWETIASNEVKQYQQSVSGQFKIALEEVKLQLATLGEPFVKIATSALGAVSNIIELFNKLPDAVKTGIAGLVGLAAIAGPLVMLAGLLGNLIGNAMKFGATFIGVITKAAGAMGVLDKQGRIYLKVAELQESEERQLADATNTLAMELIKLAEAQLAANKATEAATTISARASAAYEAQMAAAAEARALQQAMVPDLYRDADDPVTGAPVIYHGTKEGTRFTKEEAEARGRARLAQEQADIAKETAESNERNAKASEKTKKGLSGAAIAGHALAASMLLTMTNSNETLNTMGEFLMIASLAGPAVWALGKGAAWLATNFSIAAIQAKVGAAWTKVWGAYTATAAVAAGRFALGMNAASTAIKGGGALGALRAIPAFLMAALTPMGLIATAVVGIGAGLFMWKRHMDKVHEEQEKFHMDLNRTAEDWAEKMGLVKKEYKEIGEIQKGITEQSAFDKALEAYKDDSMDSAVKAFADTAEGVERTNAALDVYTTLQADYGMTADEAAVSLQALYEAAGLSAYEADQMIQQLNEDVGNINMGSGTQFQIQAGIYFNQEANSKAAEDAAKDVGEAFAQEFASADPGEQTAALFQKLRDTVNRGWNAAWADIASSPDSGLTTTLKEVGITTGEQLRQAIGEAGGKENLLMELFPDDAMTRAIMYDQLSFAVGAAEAVEKQLVQAVAKNLRGLDDSTDSVYKLLNSIEALQASGQGLSLEKAKSYIQILSSPRPAAMVNSLLPGLKGMDKAIYQVAEGQELAAANAILMSQGFQQAKTIEEALLIITGQLPGKIDRAAGAARGLAGALFTAKNAASQIDFQGVMNTVQQQIADDYSSAMNDSLDADLQNTQDYWDKKVDAAGNAGEKARAALDAAWEKRNAAAEKYWDHRIELVENAIKVEQDAEEKRQKMFDAEIARIEKLNDMANANIDFNVALNEGKLDEAAKLRNDLQAQSDETAIERARDKLSEQSEKRISRLEKKRDRLEKKRDAVMEAMQKQEDQQKAHLDRMTEANQAAVEAQRDAAVKAKEEEIAAQKELLAESIEVFMSGTAAEKSEMKKRMEDAGLSYKWFQEHVIEPKGLKWGQYFGDMMQSELKKSADKIRSDAMWEEMGKSALEKMAKGMGFSSMRSLIHFLNTGEMKDFNDTAAGNDSRQKKNEDMLNRHEGGWVVGTGGGSRKGVARTQRNNSPEERTLRAKVGEFVVNAKSAAMNRKSLEAINSGKFGADSGPFGTGGISNGQGPVPFFSAGFTRGMALRTAANIGTYTKGFRAGLTNDLGPGSAAFPGAGFVQGGGGRHRPVMGGVITQGIHPTNAIDIGVPVGTPVYSVADGRVSGSYDIPGFEPRQPDGGNGYKSYGRVITIDHGGFSTLYAHLSQRSVAAGQVLKGGARIGLSGDTGNSSGPHLHFGAPGANPYSFMSLRKGAQNIRFNDTLANLHKNEAVLTEDINRQFQQGVERFAEGPGNDYTVIVNPSRGMDEEMLANKVVRKVKQLEKRKPQTRTVGKT
jgi:murein DD-endopeptidase MepM/ murein hydrolase activator NlpD